MSEQIDALCDELSLTAVANHYATLADEAAKKKRSFVDFLETVLAEEASLREERRRETLRRMAAFPSIKTLEQFDFEAAPRCSQSEDPGACRPRLHRASRERHLPGPPVAPARAIWRLRSASALPNDVTRCASSPPLISCCSSRKPVVSIASISISSAPS